MLQQKSEGSAAPMQTIGGISDEFLANLPEDFMGEELKTSTLAKMAAVQCLQVSTLDTERYTIAVENLEATLSSRLDDTYKEKLQAVKELLVTKGKLFAESIDGRAYLATIKFRQLMELIDRQKIEDRELKT